MIAVPRTLRDLLHAAQCKLGLHKAVAVYTKNGGLIDDVDLIRYGSIVDAMHTCKWHVTILSH